MEQTASLIQAVWTIFENQWSQRNKILHGNENELIASNKQQKYKRYMEFRRSKYQMLRRCDHHMMEHPNSDVIKWSQKYMWAILKNLEEIASSDMEENILSGFTTIFAIFK